MHMPTVESLLTQLFEGRGYQVARNQTVEGATGTAYKVPILAKSGKDTVLVWTSLEASIASGDAEQLATAVHDTGSDLGVVAALAGADPGAVAAAAHGRVEVWSRGRLALELGEMMLHQAEDAHPPLVRTPAPAPPPPEAVPVPVAKAQPRRFASLIQQAVSASDGASTGGAVLVTGARREVAAAPPGPLSYAWGGGPATRSYNPNATYLPGHATRQVDAYGNEVHGASPAAAAPPAPAHSAAPPPSPPAPALNRPEAGQALALRVDEAQAIRAASAEVGAAGGARLVLEPSIAFTWAWAGWIDPAKPPMTTKGVLLVSSVDGRMHEITDPEWAGPPAGDRLDGRITAVDVYDKVKGRLAKLTTREVQVQREVGGEQIFEKRRVGPKSPDEMGFEHHGVVWSPVWIVSGARGEARVDAFTGEVRAPQPASGAPRETGAEVL